jgi:uncharacterized protein YdaU (DUF1376 family)
MYYYSFHLGDYRAATAHLTNEEDLTYRRLLDWYYDTEKPIPEGDIERVSRRLRVDANNVLTILQDFFTLDNGVWHNYRAEKEIADYHDKLTKLSRAGKASANKRAINKRPTDVEHQQDDVQLTINQKPITNNQKPNKKLSMPDGMDQTIWEDWLALRKSRKAPVTATALNGIQREANKAGIPLEDVLSICCERGWISFKADWIKDDWRKTKNNNTSPQLAAARTIFGDERSVIDVKKIT